MSNTNIANDTAALIPDVVREAFAATKSLSLRDIILLESAGVTFFATGTTPTFFEMASVYWLIADRAAFMAAVDSGAYRTHFLTWSAALSPSCIKESLPSLTDILTRTFRPLMGGGKKPGEGETTTAP